VRAHKRADDDVTEKGCASEAKAERLVDDQFDEAAEAAKELELGADDSDRVEVLASRSSAAALSDTVVPAAARSCFQPSSPPVAGRHRLSSLDRNRANDDCVCTSAVVSGRATRNATSGWLARSKMRCFGANR
jgi:hypothetical protein